MGTNKKIAILTQPLTSNYGGIIQNYALQKVLRDLEYNPITINRGDDNPNPKFKIFVNKYKLWIYRFIFNKKIVIFSDHNKILRNNSNFIKRNISVSQELSSNIALKKYFTKEDFSAVVVGSDQVWRPIYSPYLSNFFLDFLKDNKKIVKISYAASFGTSEWEYNEEQTKVCSDLIQDFNGVSVREHSGVNLCKNHLNKQDALIVLDPTLLLQASDYSQLINSKEKKIGLFTYILDEKDTTNSFIKNVAQTLKLDINRNQAKRSDKRVDLDHLSDYVIPPIEGWLQGFRDAEFVLTDSFHGTVFSIINKKPFFALVNKERGASRFESLVTQLGLEDRLIYDIDNFDFSKLDTPIDYDRVYKKLNSLREEAFNFLKQNLEC